MQDTWKTAIIAAATAGIVSFIFAVAYPSSSPTSGSQSQSTSRFGSSYGRVISTSTIRAGYVAYPPASIVEPGAKSVNGIFPELLRAIGNSTGLEIKFTEEVGWATLIEGLETGRYDIIGGVWANPNRGKMSTISAPVYYTGIGVWVRPNETRFSSDHNWASLNDKSVRIAAIDGSTPLSIAKAQFPKATLVTYPNLTTEPQLFLDVVQNKADVFFAEPSQAKLFLKNNPGALKDISSNKPLRVFGNVFLMKRSEPQLKILIDTAVTELQHSGLVEELLQKYEPVAGAFLRLAPPYRIKTAPSAQNSQ